LGEVEPRVVALNADAEEVFDRSHVLHGEGILEAGDDLEKQAGG